MRDTPEAGDAIISRYPTDLRRVVSVEIDKSGDIDFVELIELDNFGNDHIRLEFEDRANDPIVELVIPLADVLEELNSIHNALQYEYQHAAVGLVVEQREQMLGSPAWKWEIKYEIQNQSDAEGDPSLNFVLGWEDGEDGIKKLANDLMENAVEEFTLT